MSFLFPLFLAGSLAIGLPILLHMIRQRTRERVHFSSLMFFRPTAPRLRHRRRLENLLLLLLRCAIVILLALAFARPFFPRPTTQQTLRVGRRQVLLIDTSASMRRAGVAEQVTRAALSVLGQTTVLDRVCVMRFDQTLASVLSFDEWENLEPDQRAPVALDRIAAQSPTWAATDLGQALMGAAEALEDDDVGSEQAGSKQVVLVSDLQQGSQVQALHAYQWPQDIELIVKSVDCKGPTNAALQWVHDRRDLDDVSELSPRIRVTNTATARSEQFRLQWADASGAGGPVYVVPGHGVTVDAPAQAQASRVGRLTLTGDDHNFDNNLYLATPTPQQINILYLGRDDPSDPEAMLYYIRRALGSHGLQRFQVNAHMPQDSVSAADIATAHLIVVTDRLAPATLQALRSYLESGRTVLLALNSAEQAGTLTGLSGAQAISVSEAEVDEYAMLEHLELDHPLLQPFAAPGFSDFTQVHIWHYRRVDLSTVTAQVLARLDTDDPAWFVLPVGQGQLVCLASAWHPADSDLALSSKFVPLIYSILESSGISTGQSYQYFVGEPLPLSALRSSPGSLRIRLPDNTVVPLEPGQTQFTATDQPGIYTVESAGARQVFAVNLASRESRTELMPLEELEHLGLPITDSSARPAVLTEQARQRRSLTALEGEQKIWRWVLLAVWGVLLMEIGLSGWLTRVAPMVQGEQP